MLGGIFALFLLSMAGIPLTGGFIAKLSVFSAAISGGAVPLVIVGVVASAIAAYFYVRVIVLMFFRDPPSDAPAIVLPSVLTTVTIAVTAVITLLLGIVPQPLLDLPGRQPSSCPERSGHVTDRSEDSSRSCVSRSTRARSELGGQDGVRPGVAQPVTLQTSFFAAEWIPIHGGAAALAYENIVECSDQSVREPPRAMIAAGRDDGEVAGSCRGHQSGQTLTVGEIQLRDRRGESCEEQ